MAEEVSDRVRALAEQHLDPQAREHFEGALDAASAILAATEGLVFVASATVHQMGALILVTESRLIGVDAGSKEVILDLPTVDVTDLAVTWTGKSAGLAVSAGHRTIEIGIPQDDGPWGLAEAIDAARPATEGPPPTDGRPDETVLDPGVAFVCTNCGSQYTDRFGGSMCLDCGGTLHTAGGELVDRGTADADEDADDDWDDESSSEYGALAAFPTENPYLRRIFERDDYGAIPAGAIGLLGSASPDPEERLLAAIRCLHGRFRRGYLLITTDHLRWIQTLPYREEDFWPLDYALEVEGGPLQRSVIHVDGGRQFQIRWSKAKAFAEVYRLVQQAAEWAATHVAPSAEPQSLTSDSSGLAQELERLARLFEQGLLDEGEFRAAKARLLG